jgi:hypothetical protein
MSRFKKIASLFFATLTLINLAVVFALSVDLDWTKRRTIDASNVAATSSIQIEGLKDQVRNLKWQLAPLEHGRISKYVPQEGIEEMSPMWRGIGDWKQPEAPRPTVAPFTPLSLATLYARLIGPLDQADAVSLLRDFLADARPSDYSPGFLPELRIAVSGQFTNKDLDNVIRATRKEIKVVVPGPTTWTGVSTGYRAVDR